MSTSKDFNFSRNSNGEIILDFKNNETYTIQNWDINYNGYNEFKDFVNGGWTTVEIRGMVTGNNKNRKASYFLLNYEYKLNTKDNVYMIGYNGWAPCEVIKNNTIILADRNVITDIKKRYTKGGNKKNDAHPIDNVFLFTKNAELDLTLWTLEGNQRCEQTEDQLMQQFVEAKEKVNNALPNLQIHGEQNIKERLLSLHNYMKLLMKNRVDFLVEVMPLASKTFSKKHYSEKEIIDVARSVIYIADKHGLKRGDPSVFLIILRIIGRHENSESIAKKITKDGGKDVFTSDKAYNTASDLFAIEYLVNKNIANIKDNLEPNAVLLTKDLGLAELAIIMSQISKHSPNGEVLSLDTQIPMRIFYGVDILIKIMALLKES